MMELTDRRRNAILQTAIIRAERGQRGAPESYGPEEKAYYLDLEKEILDNLSRGIKPNYSISCCNDDDW